jgi:phosphoglycolate phosphatase
VPAYRTIILDFDGTLVESVGIKDNAFETLFAEHSDALTRIMDYHRAHNHVLRFEKFRYITETILNRAYTADDEERLGAAFHDIVVDGLVNCPEVNGARAFLDRFHGEVPLYLVSKSPDAEFREVVAARGMDRYFAAIYTGDWDKADAIRDIVQRQDIGAPDAVYIGDTPEDHAAAVAAGVGFIGRDSGRPFPPAMNPLFRDMDEIHRYLLHREAS